MVLQVLHVLIYSIALSVGIPGNLLVILTIGQCGQFYTVRYLLLASLALSDLLYGVFVTFSRVISVGERDWIFSMSWCYANSFFACSFLLTTTLHLCAVTWECHNAVTRPLRFNDKITVAKSIKILSLWIIPLLFAATSFLGWGTFRYNEETNECEQSWKIGDVSSISRILVAVVFFHILPFGIMTKHQLNIRRIAKLHSVELSHREQMSNDSNNANNCEQVKIRQNLRASKDALIILGAFLVSYLPVWGAGIWRVRCPTSEAAAIAWFVSTCFLQAGMCCNPIIYSLRRKTFRRELIRFLKCEKLRASRVYTE